MDLLLVIVITLQIAKIISKKHVSSSEESIENLLYYKDCQHKKKEEPTVTPTPLRGPDLPPQREPECPFPKMCCSLSCGNECGSQSSFSNTFMEPIPPIKPLVSRPRQPQISVQPPIGPKGKKKKMKMPQKLLPPIGGRRDFGFTKEKIKSLISQDQDIRKILKDLVRVTMQKVDLVEMLNGRRSAVPQKVKTEVSTSEEDN